MTKARPAIYAELQSYGQGKTIPTDAASQKLYCSLDYLTSINSSSTTPPSQTTVPVEGTGILTGGSEKLTTGTIILIAAAVLGIAFLLIKKV